MDSYKKNDYKSNTDTDYFKTYIVNTGQPLERF